MRNYSGCYFHGCEDENSTVLARYNELEGQPAAVVKCKVGKGCAILSGVHFEYGDSCFRDFGYSGGIYEKVRSSSICREFFVKMIVDRLLGSSKPKVGKDCSCGIGCEGKLVEQPKTMAVAPFYDGDEISPEVLALFKPGYQL